MNSIIEAQEEFEFWATRARVLQLRVFAQAGRAGKMARAELVKRALNNTMDHSQDAINYISRGYPPFGTVIKSIKI